MQSLADLQARFAHAVTMGARDVVAASLVGGADPLARLDVHLRHYETSLTGALREKFPACAWLVGADLVNAAARLYVRARPPRQPCIVEYGADFPRLLAHHGRAAGLPYLESFATLEWNVGQVSIAIDRPPLAWGAIAHNDPECMLDATLSLQPSLRYLRAAWRIDWLMETYLSGTEPERLALLEADTPMEIRGARGNLRLARLDAASFTFRRALAARRAIGAAASCALDCDPAFDAGLALRELAEAGLVTGISMATEPAS